MSIIGNTVIVTNNYKYNSARLLLDDIKNSNSFYCFIGDSVTNSDPVDLFDYPKDMVIDCYHNMIMGQRITPNNYSVVIKNIPYIMNEIYDIYDDSDKFLNEKNYYTIVDEIGYNHVYKCIDNNFKSKSTIQPTFSDISGANTNFYRTSDGYVWKYMYSVVDADVDKFGSTEFFPVIANTTVSNNAVKGSIDFVKIDNTGIGYNNYLYDTFSASDIKINGNTKVYAVTNSIASSLNGFYTGCCIYLSEGIGAGQYRTIVDYFISNSGNYLVLDSEFSVNPTNGTKYQITPKVNMYGSGSETVRCDARALINAYSSNSIYKVEILERGRDYAYAFANVYASDIVSVVEKAELRVVQSPPNGHGYDAAKELNAHHICIYTVFNSNNITVNTSTFAQLGIVRNPLFSSVKLGLSNNYGNFIFNEKVHKIKPFLLDRTCNVSSNSTLVTNPNGDYANQLVSGSHVYMTFNNVGQFATVNSVVNATAFNLTVNSYFTASNTAVYLADPIVSSKVKSIVNANAIEITEVHQGFAGNNFIIGEISGATGVINTISINKTSKNLDSFINLYRYDCTVNSGTFATNELVYVGNSSVANATLHSAIVNGSNVTIYTSNQTGIFSVGRNIIGNYSGASALIVDKYLPELIYGSGDVVYLENISPNPRSSNGESETIKTIFEF